MLLTGLTQVDIDKRKAEAERQAEIAALTTYLTSTDWYATRLAETGKAIPDEILTARQAARERISELKRIPEPINTLK